MTLIYPSSSVEDKKEKIKLLKSLGFDSYSSRVDDEENLWIYIYKVTNQIDALKDKYMGTVHTWAEISDILKVKNNEDSSMRDCDCPTQVLMTTGCKNPNHK